MNKRLLIPAAIGINNFDLIRFLLASSVIYCHCFAIFYGYDTFLKKEPFMVLSQEQISIGSVAVDFFFVISGFLIVKSFEFSKTYVQYLIKRVLRIYPGFIVAFLISIFLIGFLGNANYHSLAGYWQYLHDLHKKQELAHLLTLQSPAEKYYFRDLPQTGLNNSLWTIQYEFICYLIIPAISFAGFFKRPWLFGVGFFIAYTILYLQQKGLILPYKETGNLLLANPFHYPRFITYFLAGSCFYMYRNKFIKSKYLAILSFSLTAFSFVGVKCVDQVLPIAGGYLLFYIAYHPGLQFSQFSKKGDYSYGLYLYGWPVQQSVMYLLVNHLNPFRLFFIAYPVALAFAVVSWHLIEKQFLYFKRKNPPPVISSPRFSPLVRFLQ